MLFCLLVLHAHMDPTVAESEDAIGASPTSPTNGTEAFGVSSLSDAQSRPRARTVIQKSISLI